MVEKVATLATLNADLAEARAARSKVLSGQEYTLHGQHVRRADLTEINRLISELEFRLARLSGGHLRQLDFSGAFRGGR